MVLETFLRYGPSNRFDGPEVKGGTLRGWACQLSADEDHLRATGLGNGDDAGKKIDGRCTATSHR